MGGSLHGFLIPGHGEEDSLWGFWWNLIRLVRFSFNLSRIRTLFNQPWAWTDNGWVTLYKVKWRKDISRIFISSNF